MIDNVSWEGLDRIERSSVTGGSYFREGASLTDELVYREMARVDSIMFAAGLLGASVSVDTTATDRGVALRIVFYEGEPARIGNITVSSAEGFTPEQLRAELGVESGAVFDPAGLGGSMGSILEMFNNSGYPYAQVWMTGFDYNDRSNTVDLSFAVYRGDESMISGLVFEGLVHTDTALARRISGLEVGSGFDERKIERAGRRLSASDLFGEVGDPRIVRRREGMVDVHFPVEERKHHNRIQGIFGFSRKENGDYRTNGSIELGLENIGGTGRNVDFRWLNDGEDFQKTWFAFTEPYVLSLPMHLDIEMSQDIYDTLYDFTMAGFDIRIPIEPAMTVTGGFTWDSNVPRVEGDLKRSVRKRFRLGLGGAAARSSTHYLYIEGARKTMYLGGNREDSQWQVLAGLAMSSELRTFDTQSFFTHLAAKGVFSSGDISPAEMYPLGGARSLRGYRENQFRGERIAWMTFEYRFGGESRIFLFDDLGTYYRQDQGWTLKNGFGFGLRSSSQLGTVELSFGVGERLSLEETRIHISLIESF
jgi:outer membrane protein assembly factor BamA